MNTPTLRQLLEAGVHFGHQTSRWNPKMRRYIFADRNGIHVIDLQKTVEGLEQASAFLGQVATQQRPVLFVGTKKQAQEAVEAEAKRCNQHFVSHRWMGGLLTNWTTIQRRIKRLKELRVAILEQAYHHMTKKDQKAMSDELAELEANFSGIAEMRSLPGALIVIDPRKEGIAMTEANKLRIPVVALTDTNCDPDEVTYVIPGNDDAIRSVRLVLTYLADAVREAAALVSVEELERQAAESEGMAVPAEMANGETAPAPADAAPAPEPAAAAPAPEPASVVPPPSAERTEEPAAAAAEPS